MDEWRSAGVDGKRRRSVPSNSDTSRCYYLPEELREEILSRLPVRSLRRFRCVCKPWRDLIEDKKFVALHLKNYKTSYLLLGNYNEDYSIASLLPSYGFDDAGRPALQKVADFKQPGGRNSPMRMAGTCNGIICLYRHVAQSCLLWNPATKDVKVIPQSSLQTQQRQAYYSVGFGFDPQRNDYKILQLVHYRNSMDVIQLELYSLRADSWRKIDCDRAIKLRDDDIAHGIYSLSYTQNRFVCFLLNPEPRQQEIMCFDMSRERSETIKAPLLLDGLAMCYNLFPFKASIALGICYVKGNGSGAHFAVYVLNDFYPTRRYWTNWIKLFTVNKKHCCLARPVASLGNLFIYQEIEYLREFLLLQNESYHDNTHAPTLVKLPFVRFLGDVTASVYRESLVRISDIK